MAAAVFEGASLQAYRERLSSCVTLDRAVERDLARRYLGGDRDAGAKLVSACLPFVMSIAIEYRRWGVPLEDIIQQGNLGLLKATAKFDPERDVRLATYAAYWIRAEIRDYVVRGYRVVRLGTTKSERRALRAYRTTRESDPVKLAALSGLTTAKAEALLPMLAAREVSLDASTADMPPAVDRLPSPGPSPEEETAGAEVRSLCVARIRKAMRGLTARERLIVRERMMNDEPLTLQELGTRLGVSKERVRQLEARARGKLREELGELSATA